MTVSEERSLEVRAYLERINYHGSLGPSAETLRQLHLAHLLAVPFENLSIHAGEPIVLEDEALFDKIVVRRRGGFCYELNGLFAALLRALGFRVSMLSARVSMEGGGFGPEFDHMTLLVDIEERWLADVGFGDSFREPLRLDERGEQRQGDRTYRIEVDGDRLLLMQREGEGPWDAKYRFGLQPHVPADYAEMCRYHQTSNESPFTQRRVCSLATVDGRVTLRGSRLITTRRGERQEREVAGESEQAKVLWEHFGVKMPDARATR